MSTITTGATTTPLPKSTSYYGISSSTTSSSHTASASHASASNTTSASTTAGASVSKAVSTAVGASVSKAVSSTAGASVSKTASATVSKSSSSTVKTTSSTTTSGTASTTTKVNTSVSSGAVRTNSSLTSKTTNSASGVGGAISASTTTHNSSTTPSGNTSALTDRTGLIVGHEVSAAASSVTAKVKEIAAIRKEEQQTIENQLIELGFFNPDGASEINPDSTNADSVSCNFEDAKKNFCYLYCRNANGTVNYDNEIFKEKLKMVSDTYQKILEKDAAGNDKLDAIFSNDLFGDTGDEIKKSFSKAWTFLKLGMGFSDELAAAIMGNWYAESAISETDAENIPGRDNPNHVYKENVREGWGLMQWTDPDRKKGLLALAGEMNSGVGNINVQLACFRREIMEGVEGAENVKSEWEKHFSTDNTTDHITDEIAEKKVNNYALDYMEYMESPRFETPEEKEDEQGKRKDCAWIIYKAMEGEV